VKTNSVALAGALALSAFSAAASIPNPTVTGPIASTAVPGDASHDYIFFSTNHELAVNGYIEEEYFIDGLANTYNTPAGATGSIATTNNPYKTRIVVRRPADKARFNGTVLVEWYNVTNGFDAENLWFFAWEHILRAGYVWVGVSAQKVGVDRLKSWPNTTRYSTLNISSDAVAYDAFSQAGQAIRHPGGIDVLGGLKPKTIIATGESQSAQRLSVYVNSIMPLGNVYDGVYLLSNFGQAIRTDPVVPIFKTLFEWDTQTGEASVRQSDSSVFHRWEVAGTAHVDHHLRLSREPLELRDLAGVSSEANLAPTCTVPSIGSQVPNNYVVDAAIEMAAREQFKLQGAYFISAAEADQLARVVATPQRTLNPAIVGKSVEVIADMAGLSVPPGTRCIMADVGGVGRDFPLSMEKLSPILAFYVEDGIERGAARCNEILHYGGMGHTAGIHTRSREAAVRYGAEMPASRITVNTPTTHGAIGFSTALPPSMTLGCGSWGGNVTSDNVSPLHLLDIKRVAFETRAVASKRPAVAAQATAMPPQPRPAGQAATATPTARGGGAAKVSREEIASIVDRFLANRPPETPRPSPTRDEPASPRASETNQRAAPSASTNGRKAAEFVSEDDVRRAIQKGEKIYVGPRTIITPSARDIGDPGEVFAKA